MQSKRKLNCIFIIFNRIAFYVCQTPSSIINKKNTLVGICLESQNLLEKTAIKEKFEKFIVDIKELTEFVLIKFNSVASTFSFLFWRITECLLFSHKYNTSKIFFF